MKTVSGALTVLFVAITFVYVVFFGVHGNDFTTVPQLQQTGLSLGEQEQETTGQLIIDSSTGSTGSSVAAVMQVQEQVAAGERREGTDENDEQTTSQAPEEATDSARRPARTGQETPPEGPDDVTFYSVQELFDEENVAEPDYLALSGTHRWSGTVKSLQMLGLQDDAEYILKDNLNTHYVYLGTFNQQLESHVLSLSGNIVEIGDETAIKQHALLGDTVWFINLPAFEDIKVLMIIFFEDQDDAWFLQIDQSSYYRMKPVLQESFGKFYDRGE